MRLTKVALLGFLMALAVVPQAMAEAVYPCMCYDYTEKRGAKSFFDADVVIGGDIVKASEGFSNLGPLLKITPVEIYKGNNLPELMTANYNSTPAACGNRFAVGEHYIIALYDTRTIGVQNNNTRGYGFRVMYSCVQDEVRRYLSETNMQPMEIREQTETNNEKKDED